jgi:hypothetical protein
MALPLKLPHHPVVLEQEVELKTNTQLTREIHQLTTELHRRLIDRRARPEK